MSLTKIWAAGRLAAHPASRDKTMIYDVIRPHIGDRTYRTGERREADPAEVRHLVPHVLRPVEECCGAEPSAGNPERMTKVVKAQSRKARP